MHTFKKTLAHLYIFRVRSQPGNQGIITELESGPFFTEQSGSYREILIEYQENQGKVTLSK